MNDKNKPFFSLPPKISCKRTLIEKNVHAFVFRHVQLGEIGRLIILPKAKGSEFIYEAIGEPDDPMKIKRQELFEPIAKNIIQTFNQLFWKHVVNYSPSVAPNETAIMKNKTMLCTTCAAPVATIFIASNAYSADYLEDCARLIFAKINQLNVPAWIIGEEQQVSINGDLVGEALVLKIWPQRKAAKVVSSTELNEIFAKLMKNHCIDLRKCF